MQLGILEQGATRKYERAVPEIGNRMARVSDFGAPSRHGASWPNKCVYRRSLNTDVNTVETHVGRQICRFCCEPRLARERPSTLSLHHIGDGPCHPRIGSSRLTHVACASSVPEGRIASRGDSKNSQDQPLNIYYSLRAKRTYREQLSTIVNCPSRSHGSWWNV